VLGFVVTLFLLPAVPRTHAFWRQSPCSPAEEATSQLPLCPELLELNRASHHFLKDLAAIDEPRIRAELQERQRRVDQAQAELQERQQAEAKAARDARQERQQLRKHREEEERKWREQRAVQKQMIEKREGYVSGPSSREDQPESRHEDAKEQARRREEEAKRKQALEKQKEALEKEAIAEKQQQEAALEKLRKQQEEEEEKQEEAEEKLEEDKLATCRKAKRGETCYVDVVWSMHEGIHEHPDWYPGLTSQSSFEEFQFVLNVTGGESKCPKPCLVAQKEHLPLTGCRTATPADEHCYMKTLWAKTHGIYEHPNWYEGLTGNSSFEMFQNYLRTRRNIDCPHPCVVAVMK